MFVLNLLHLVCIPIFVTVMFFTEAFVSESNLNCGIFSRCNLYQDRISAIRDLNIVVSAKKRVRKGSPQNDNVSDEDSDVVKLPPLPSQLSRLGASNFDDSSLMDLLKGNTATAVPLLDVEIGQLELEKGPKGPVKTNKYTFDLDFELPVESENRDGSDKNLNNLISKLDSNKEKLPLDGVVRLPDLKELGQKMATKKAENLARPAQARIERGDIASFTKLLELDPEADSDSSLFNKEEYDYVAAALGEGVPFVGLPNSFLQSGHTVLAVLCVLCAFVSYPGFPLTELPYDLKLFLQRGLLVIYVINIGIVPSAISKAKALGQPPFFWGIKTLLLGGLAYNELSQIEMPKMMSKKSLKRNNK